VKLKEVIKLVVKGYAHGGKVKGCGIAKGGYGRALTNKS
jgi:hypothetical protein